MQVRDLPKHIADHLHKRGWESYNTITADEAFREYVEWRGIIGFADTFREVLDKCREVELLTQQPSVNYAQPVKLRLVVLADPNDITKCARACPHMAIRDNGDHECSLFNGFLFCDDTIEKPRRTQACMEAAR